MADYVVRSVGSVRVPLTFSAEAVRVLRRDANGMVVVLWGERVVSGVLTRHSNGADSVLINLNGDVLELTVREAMLDAMAQGLAAAGPAGGHLELRSPIPGLVKNVLVKPGETVRSGQNLIVLEAMKMENEIAAIHDGTVETIDVKPGQAVAAGALLAVLKIS